MVRPLDYANRPRAETPRGRSRNRMSPRRDPVARPPHREDPRPVSSRGCLECRLLFPEALPPRDVVARGGPVLGYRHAPADLVEVPSREVRHRACLLLAALAERGPVLRGGPAGIVALPLVADDVAALEVGAIT